MSETLKPCPFCGNPPVLRKFDTGWGYIFCKSRKCKVHPSTIPMRLAYAVRRWNKRTNQGGQQ